MAAQKGVIEFVCEGGIGGSAKVCVESRIECPGTGGTVTHSWGVLDGSRDYWMGLPSDF